MPETIVHLPNNDVLHFPEGMSDGEMQIHAAKYLQESGYIDRNKTGIGPTGTHLKGTSSFSSPQTTQNLNTMRDMGIDLVRPLASGAAATAAATAALPVDPFTLGGASLVAGGGAYLGMDALLQYLKSNPQQNSGLAQLINAKQGGASATIANSIQQALEVAGGAKLLRGVSAGIKAIRDVDLPEIQNFLPTTGQAANSALAETPKPDIASQGIPTALSNWWTRLKLNVLGTGASTLEGFNTKARSAALDRTGGAGFTQALQTSKELGFDLQKDPFTGHFQDPMDPAYSLITHPDRMPLGEGSYTPIKIKPGKDYQPLTRTETYQPKTEPTIIPGEPDLHLYDSYKKIDDVIADVDKLKNTLAVAQVNGTGDNLKKAFQQRQFSKMFNDATTRDVATGNPYTDNVVRINPKSFNDTWTDPAMQKSLKELYNAPQRANIEQFFKNIEMTQDKVSSFPMAKPLWMLRGGVGISMGLVTSMLTGNVAEGALAGGAGITGMVLGGDELAKMLTNPKTGRFLVRLAGGEAPGASEQFIGKMMSQVLNGSTVALIDSKGEKHPGQLKDGSFIPLAQ
jgi:hypothetical protein